MCMVNLVESVKVKLAQKEACVFVISYIASFIKIRLSIASWARSSFLFTDNSPIRTIQDTRLPNEILL